MPGLVRNPRSQHDCARRLRIYLLGVCMAILTLAGPGGVAYARAEAPCETESKSQAPGSELVENLTLHRICDRTHIHCMRRAFRCPTGSCAGDRTFSFSHHVSTRPLNAEHRDRNGFGGPLLR